MRYITEICGCGCGHCEVELHLSRMVIPFLIPILLTLFHNMVLAQYVSSQCTQPCTNGRVCQPDGDGRSCQCLYPYYGNSCQYFDQCISNPCSFFATCIRWEDGTYKCLCDILQSGERCSEFGHMCSNLYDNVDDCENAALCSIVNDNRVCSCIPGTEGDRCQNYTRTHAVDAMPIRTRSLDSLNSWSSEVCMMVGLGSAVDIDIGWSYFVQDITVVLFSHTVNVTLLAMPTLGDPEGYTCTHLEAVQQSRGTPIQLPCPGGPKTRYFRLKVGNLGDNIPQALCVGGVLLYRYRSGLMKQETQSPTHVLSTFSSPSLIECGILCFEKGDCMSFDWHNVTHQCSMLGETSNTVNGIARQPYGVTRQT